MRGIAQTCQTGASKPHPTLFPTMHEPLPGLVIETEPRPKPEPEPVAVRDTRPFPKVNRKVTWNRYFAQVTKFLKKRYQTCIRSYGLFIKGDPEEILDYIKACYRIYDKALDDEIQEFRKDPEREEWRKEVDFEGRWLKDFERHNRRSFHYFVNRDPKNPGLIYYGQRGELTELKEGDVVGFHVPSSCWTIGHAG